MHKTRGAAGTQARMKWQASVKNQAAQQAKLSASNMRRAGNGSTTNTSKIPSAAAAAAAARVCVVHAWCFLRFKKRTLTTSTATCAKLGSAAVHVLRTRHAVFPPMLMPNCRMLLPLQCPNLNLNSRPTHQQHPKKTR
jgi:hypothetical protein